MPEFSLPHDHGAHGHTEDLYREMKNVEHFGAVCDIFKQLSDPTRVRIFWLLSHREECVINIAALLDMSSPAVSHHLRSLAQSGLIESRRCGKEVYYKAGDTMQIKLLHEIVEQVMQIACPEKAVDYQDSQEQIIRHVHNELTANLAERVTIEELSRKYLMNTTTLKRCFKQVYGETIAAHMKKHRMEQAASLLLKTQNDIAAIAQAVGYESQSRFTAAFKETYGEHRGGNQGAAGLPGGKPEKGRAVPRDEVLRRRQKGAHRRDTSVDHSHPRRRSGGGESRRDRLFCARGLHDGRQRAPQRDQARRRRQGRQAHERELQPAAV